MTRVLINKKNNKNATFSGTISNYDFYGCLTMRDVANRIVVDMMFDKQCRKNLENQKRKAKNNV